MKLTHVFLTHKSNTVYMKNARHTHKIWTGKSTRTPSLSRARAHLPCYQLKNRVHKISYL